MMLVLGASSHFDVSFFLVLSLYGVVFVVCSTLLCGDGTWVRVTPRRSTLAVSGFGHGRADGIELDPSSFL